MTDDRQAPPVDRVRTYADVMIYATEAIDRLIADYLELFEATFRRQIAATGPEDEEALDRPPDPESPWQRITVEEAVLIHAARLGAWKASTLADLGAQFRALYAVIDTRPG
jgi:hypothetical protein